MAGFLKKIWKPRIVEYPGRRRLDDTSQPEVYDVSRAEGNIIQQGDGFTADNMNDLEERIASSFNELNENIDGLTKYVNSSKYKITTIDSLQITNGYVYFGYSNKTIISAYCNANIFLPYVVTGEWYAKVLDSAGNIRESGTLNNVDVVYFNYSQE